MNVTVLSLVPVRSPLKVSLYTHLPFSKAAQPAALLEVIAALACVSVKPTAVRAAMRAARRPVGRCNFICCNLVWLEMSTYGGRTQFSQELPYQYTKATPFRKQKREKKLRGKEFRRKEGGEKDLGIKIRIKIRIKNELACPPGEWGRIVWMVYRARPPVIGKATP